MDYWHYAYAGLHVVSELQLPEWDSYAESAVMGAADVWISCATTREQSLERGQMINTDEQFSLVVPEVAAYQVRAGNSIQVRPATGAGWREVRLFLLGAVWAALLYQRGSYPLHASVVRVGDSAVAFCGPSGAGKSTVAVWLLQRGYQLVSDDLCRCEVQPNGPALVWPSTPRIKLWDDTLVMFGRNSLGLERDHYRHDKFNVPWQLGTGAEPVSLRTIYMLGWGNPAIDRLRGGAAVQRLVRDGTYRPELLQTTAQVFTQWQVCAQLASKTRIWAFSRPREAAQLEAVMHMLIQDWEAPMHHVNDVL